MTDAHSRRDFLLASAAGLAPAAVLAAEPKKEKPVSVVVWDERQPEQKQAYDDFLGNQIAAHLKDKKWLAVKSVSIEDDEKGLSPAVIRGCDVLVWWGHKRQAEVTPKMASKLARSGDGGKTWETLPNEGGWHFKAFARGPLAGGPPPKAPTTPAGPKPPAK